MQCHPENSTGFFFLFFSGGGGGGNKEIEKSTTYSNPYLTLIHCIVFDRLEILQWLALCSAPAKELMRDLSAYSSNIAFEVPLASKGCWQFALILH